MTIDAGYLPSEPPPPPGFPVAVGWTQATIAVSSLLMLKTPVNLKMIIESHGPLLIDFRHHAFSWSTPLADFPVDAVHTGLFTEPTTEDAPPYFELPGNNLDDLLWEMGINSFEGAPAFWLSPNERYKLTRWPNLTQHTHTMRQVKMIAVLGNTFVSTPELATFAGVELPEAQRLVNALSLMRILSRSAEAPAVEATVETVAATRNGLFSRLRKRLGR